MKPFRFGRNSPDFVPLYRLENPSLPFNQPEGAFFAQKLAGQWFDETLIGAFSNLSRVNAFSRRCNAPAQLAIARVVPDKLTEYLAANHPIASKMNYMDSDYIIPRDGTVPIMEVDIDEALHSNEGYDFILKVAAQAIRNM